MSVRIDNLDELTATIPPIELTAALANLHTCVERLLEVHHAYLIPEFDCRLVVATGEFSSPPPVCDGGRTGF